MPTSVRLDARTERVLERLARSRSQTKSEIVRQAIDVLAAQERKHPFEAVSDLIGCVSGGPPDLSEDTGRKYRDLLIRKRST